MEKIRVDLNEPPLFFTAFYGSFVPLVLEI